MTLQQKITPNLWFDSQAEEAANFYVSIFKNAKIGSVARYPKAAEEVSGKKAGSVMTVAFEIEGQQFVAMNGGPTFKLSEAVSFVISCEDQAEVDYYWEKLTAGGDPQAQICGWLKDKFGLSWQVVPTVLEEMMQDKNPEKSERVMAALLEMKKIDIAVLRAAYGA
ncbi:MAG: VOC family protein [Parcubacteria group bacterium]|jgi:predicted 3-demethylubiquinone-9 3-methyltransferase (glyoxalase superfamily)